MATITPDQFAQTYAYAQQEKDQNMGTAAIVIPAVATFLAQMFASSSANKQANNANALSQQQLLQQQNQSDRNTALQESLADPWRHSMFQADNVAKLDKRERGTFTPSNISMPSRYADYKPTMTGGFSYQKSPEYTQSMAALKKLVMSGQGAPTIMDPANYGETGAIDLLSVMAGLDPTQARVKKPTSYAALRNAASRPVKDASGQYDQSGLYVQP